MRPPLPSALKTPPGCAIASSVGAPERHQASRTAATIMTFFHFYARPAHRRRFVRAPGQTHSTSHHLEDFSSRQEVVRALVTQFYGGDRYLPDEIWADRARGRGVRADYLTSAAAGVWRSLPAARRSGAPAGVARENAEQGFREREDAERDTSAQRGAAAPVAPRNARADRVRRPLDFQGAWRSVRCLRSTRAPGQERLSALRIKTVAVQDDFA